MTGNQGAVGEVLLVVGRGAGGRSGGLGDSDSSLIVRSQGGDQQAFAELVRRYQAVSFRVAYVVTGSADEAEDAVQDGFIRVYRSINRFRLDAPFRPWLLRIVANAARTRRSQAGRQFALRLAEVDGASLAGEAGDSPEAIAVFDEQLRELLRAVSELGEDDRQVIALRYVLELSEAEMANVLNCARGTVKSRLSRALGRLRTVIAATAKEAPHG